MSYWPAFIYRVLKDRCWPDRLYRSDQVSSVDECWWNYSVPWCPCCTGQVLHTDDCSRITVYFSCCSGQVLSAGRLVLKDVICRGAVVWVGYSPSSKVLDKLCSFHAGCWQWIFLFFFSLFFRIMRLTWNYWPRASRRWMILLRWLFFSPL